MSRAKYRAFILTKPDLKYIIEGNKMLLWNLFYFKGNNQ